MRDVKAVTDSSIPFFAVSLYTREGKYVATVETMPWVSWPDAILWGSRCFIRDAEGHYREGFAWGAVCGMVPDHRVQNTRDLP